MLGIPALSLPILSPEGLPLGLQLTGFVSRDADPFAVGAAVRDFLGLMLSPARAA
jgi:Asp-tRNA(Asn)/Glu-tRNA(Gln) amidotransferase A subunit family amidase